MYVLTYGFRQIWRESHVVYCATVAGKLVQQLSGLNIPHSDAAVRTTSTNLFTIW